MKKMHSARIVSVSLVLFVAPFGLLACDKLKKGDADAAPSATAATTTPSAAATTAEPAATATETAPALVPGQPGQPGQPAQPGVVVPKTDAGSKDAGVALDASLPKVDGGVAPIPTPTPKGAPSLPTALPTGLPTALPTVLPTTLPSGIPTAWPPKK